MNAQILFLRLFRLRAALMACGLCIAVTAPTLAQPSAAAANRGDESAGSGDPWSRLPDGRAILDIYGVRLAVPECTYCLENFELWGEQGRGRITFRDAVAQPAKLRALVAAGDSVTLSMSNSWVPGISKGLFLGKFDPLSIPKTPRLDITITSYKQPQQCWLIPGDYECVALHQISTQSSPPSSDGLYIQPGYFRVPSDSSSEKIGRPFIIGNNITLIVTADNQVHDAVGLPMRIFCNLLRTCASSAHNGPPSFAIQPNVSLYFEFGQDDYPMSQLIAVHSHLVSVLGYILLDTPFEGKD